MHKTKIKIRPFVPIQKPEKREPFATLTYGGVTIEIDLTILRNVKLDNESLYFLKTRSIFAAGISEIEREMWSDINGELPRYHRDNENTQYHNENFSHNPLHRDNVEHITITK